MPASLIDSHCHIDTASFEGDRDAMLERATAAGVTAMIVPGISILEMPGVIALADKYPQIFIGVGIHPQEADAWNDAMIDQLRLWAKHPKVVAIGEIGLDYHYEDGASKAQQDHVMRSQTRLAKELNKPIIVHDRDAHDATLQLLKEELDPVAGGVMHCFSGSLELAKACIELGMYISFAGPLTYKNAQELREVARQLPLEHLLIETDSPYLAPAPYRGKRNEPAHVAFVAAQLAELHGVNEETVREITSANTRRLFRLPA
jgi:TatD DNase family protein